MECFSELFRKTLVKVLDSNHLVIGSISLKGDSFVRKVKEREDVSLVHVSQRNRDALARKYHEEYQTNL
jgi:nucleoside-triphosphatase THEP1